MTTQETEDDFHPTSEDIDIQPWDLPYWSGKPVEKEPEPEPEEETEEVEVEPLTVEDIEAIRSEAHEEGYLQGLNEGREKGEKEGHEEGLGKGKEEGFREGETNGRQVGFEAGHAEGLEQGKDEIAKAVAQLSDLAVQFRARVQDYDEALPGVMCQLIKSACETIVEQTLADGDDAIAAKVERALNQLPSGEENIRIYVSNSDAGHLEHGLTLSGQAMHFDVDDALEAGSCRITSTNSLIEFSTAQRMQAVFQNLDAGCVYDAEENTDEETDQNLTESSEEQSAEQPTEQFTENSSENSAENASESQPPETPDGTE